MVSAHTAHTMRQHKLVSRRFAVDKDSFVYTYKPPFKSIYHRDHLPATIGMFGALAVFAMMSLQIAIAPFVRLEKQTIAYQREAQVYLAAAQVEPSSAFIPQTQVKTVALASAPQPAVLGASTFKVSFSFFDAIKASLGDIFNIFRFFTKSSAPEIFNAEGECSSNGDCGNNAICEIPGTADSYCDCKPGYNGDGHTCTAASGGGTGGGGTIACRNNGDCGNNAICEIPGTADSYCDCEPGYNGDGHTCTAASGGGGSTPTPTPVSGGGGGNTCTEREYNECTACNTSRRIKQNTNCSYTTLVGSQNDPGCSSWCSGGGSTPTPTPVSGGGGGGGTGGGSACQGIHYNFVPANAADQVTTNKFYANSTIYLNMDRIGASKCGDNWDNVNVKLDGQNLGLGLCYKNGSQCGEGYNSTFNTGAPGVHTLQFTINNGSCSCNTMTFETVARPAACTVGSVTGLRHTVNGNSVTFSWSPATSANRYTIEVRKKGDTSLRNCHMDGATQYCCGPNDRGNGEAGGATPGKCQTSIAAGSNQLIAYDDHILPISSTTKILTLAPGEYEWYVNSARDMGDSAGTKCFGTPQTPWPTFTVVSQPTGPTVPLGGACTADSQCIGYDPNIETCSGNKILCKGTCKRLHCDLDACVTDGTNNTVQDIHTCKLGLSYNRPSGSNLCCPNSEPNCNTYCAAQAPTDNAECTVSGMPTTATVGQTVTATLSLKNTGSTTWTAATQYKGGNGSCDTGSRLGGTQASTLCFQANAEGSNIRRHFTSTDSIAPGQTKTWTNVPIVAPATPGTYTFYWKAVKEGVAWFGQACSQQITVTAASELPNYIGGQIKNAAGQGVAGAEVNLCPNGTCNETATTDGQGNYRFRAAAGSLSYAIRMKSAPSGYVLPAKTTNDQRSFKYGTGCGNVHTSLNQSSYECQFAADKRDCRHECNFKLDAAASDPPACTVGQRRCVPTNDRQYQVCEATPTQTVWQTRDCQTGETCSENGTCIGSNVGGNPTLTIKTKLRGVSKAGVSIQAVVDVLKPSESTPIQTKVVTFESDNEGVFWSGNVANGTFTRGPISLELGGYTGELAVRIKGPKHLRKRISPVPFSAAMVLTTTELLPGDLPWENRQQDGRLNESDLAAVSNNYTSLSNPEQAKLDIADVNYDGKVNSQDYSLVRQTLFGQIDQ